MKEPRSLIYKGTKLYYRVKHHYSDYGTSHKTKFYKDIKIVESRKFWIFGPRIKKIKPKGYLFSIWGNIESCKIPKEFWKNKLKENFRYIKRKKKRCKEIKNGKII